MLKNIIKSLVFTGLFFLPVLAFASIDVNKSFSPGTLSPTEISKLTITLLNSSLSPSLSVSVSDIFPAEIFFASPVNLVNSCGGIVGTNNSATKGTLTLSGGTIPGGDGINPGECKITVDVYAASKGSFVNTVEIGDVSGITSLVPESNLQIAQGTLVALLSDVTIDHRTRVGSPTGFASHLQGGESAYWVLTITNPNSIALSQASFTDVLPTGWTLTGGSTSTTCGPGSVSIPSLNTITLTGGIIPANSSCYIAVEYARLSDLTLAYNRYRVKFTVPIGVVSTREGAINSNESRVVYDIYSGVRFDHIYIDSNIANHEIDVNIITTTQARIRWRNYNIAAIGPFNFSKTFPAGLSVVSIDTNTCGATVTITGSGSGIDVAGGGLAGNPNGVAGAQAGTCEIRYTLSATTQGNYDTSVSAGNIAGYQYKAYSSLLTVTDNGFAVDFSFSKTLIYQGDTVNAIITLTNQTTSSDITNISISNDLADLGIDNGFVDTDPLFRISSHSTPAYTTCAGGIVTAIDGNTSLSFSGGTLAAGESCIIVVEMQVDTDALTPPYDYNRSGYHSDVISGSDILYTVSGANKIFAQDVLSSSIRVFRSVVLRKTWFPTSVGPGGESRLTISVNKRSYDQRPYLNMSLRDPLPSGFQVSSNPDVLNGCGGSVAANPGDTSIVLTGGEIAGNTGSQVYCYISVNVQAPNLTMPGVPESHTNRIPGDIHGSPIYFSAEDEYGNPWEHLYYNTDATLTIKAINLNINTEFLSTSINGGGRVRVRTTISNNEAGAVDISNVSFVDSFPVGVELYSEINPTFSDTSGGVTGTCRGGVFSGVSGDSSFGLSGAEIDAGATCYVEYNVTALVGGNHVNTIEIGDVTSLQGVSSANSAAATVTVGRNLNLGKGFTPSIIQAGERSTLIITVYNSQTLGNNEVGANQVLGAPQSAFIDTLPAGMSIVGVPITNCNGGVVTTGMSGGLEYIELNGGEFDAENACSVIVTVEVTSGVGVYTNTIGKNELYTVSGSQNSDNATATLTVINKASITKSFGPTAIAVDGISTLTFTLTNPNTTTLLDGIQFSDAMTNMQIASPLIVGGTCNDIRYAASVGGNSFTVTDATIPAGGNCSITVRVTSNILGDHPNQTTGLDTNQTQTTGTGSNIATLTVLSPVTIIQAFSPGSVPLGSISTLSFTFTNPNNVDVNAVNMYDIFPSGIQVAAIPNIVGTCLNNPLIHDYTTSITVTGGESSIKLAGGTLAANTSCSISVDVLTIAAGSFINTSSVLTTSAGTSTDTTANLEVTFNSLPIITLIGSGSIVQQLGSVYTELGAAANDLEDGDITSSIVISGNVDTSVGGIYTIYYNVMDSQGSLAIPVTRTIQIIDQQSPNVTINQKSGTFDPDNSMIAVFTIVFDEAIIGATLDALDIDFSASSAPGATIQSITPMYPNEQKVFQLTVVTTGYGDVIASVLPGGIDDLFNNTNTASTSIDNSITLQGNQYPTNIFLDGADSGSVDENLAIGSSVGILTSVDPDISDTHSYNLVCTRDREHDFFGDGSTLATYTFEGDATDLSGNFDGIDYGSQYAPGVFGRAIIPHDTLGAVDINAYKHQLLPQIQDVTISGWINVDTIRLSSMISFGAQGRGLAIGILDDGRAAVGSRNFGQGAQSIGPVLSTGQWYHLVTTYDAATSQLQLHVDGVAQIAATAVVYGGGATDKIGGGGGAFAAGSFYPLDGRIDQIRIFNRVLNSTEIGELYGELEASDNNFFDISGSGLITKSVFDFETPADYDNDGVYDICIQSTDSGAGNLSYTKKFSISINDLDEIAPVIIRTGSGAITQEVGGNYSDLGATCTDNYDSACSVTSSGSVDATTLGTYSITYSATDAAGNIATPMMRTIYIVDTTKPVITASGSSSQLILQGESYQGVTCTDNYDSVCSVTSSGSVDVNTPGTYTIRYSAIDSSGNIAIPLMHTIVVVDDLYDGDGDGIPDSIEKIINTNPNITDTDGDGENDSNNDLDNVHPFVELAAPNNGDGNADGALDAIQNNVSSLPNIKNAAYNSLEITNTSSCSQIHYFASTLESTFSVQDSRYDYTLGLWDFEIECTTPGSRADIQIYLDKQYDTSQWVYRKYDELTEIYTDISSIITYTTELVGAIPVTVINYSIIDGGIYDEDGLKNGIIIDPSGPAIKKGGASGSVSYDRCDGNDTSGSIYDGSCGPEEVKEIEVEKEIGQKKDYEIENDFESCTVINNINDDSYPYKKTGIFLDISEVKFQQEILKFYEIGIINGYSDGEFKPSQEMTRTEFLKIALISHCYEYENEDPSTLSYTDVDKHSWQAKVITKAQNLGMINGDMDELGNGIFRPNDIITKAEAIKILMRISLIQSNEISALGYSDITVDWHKKYIQNGEALGLFHAERDNGLFYPESGVMRQDMLGLMSKLIHLYK